MSWCLKKVEWEWKKKKNVIIIFFFFTEKKMIREMSRQGANYFPSLLHSRLKCAGE